MKIEYIKEFLEFIDSDLDLFIDESESDSLLIYSNNDLYQIDKILSENMPESRDLIYENTDEYCIMKFNLIENKESINDYYELNLYKHELKVYQKLLNESDEYNYIKDNFIGMNKLNDYIHKFHLNHKNFYSFNLDESFSDASEILSEIISYNPESFSEIEIYTNLDEFYDEIDLFSVRNYKIELSDESNIIKIRDKGIIKNIDESDLEYILKTILKNNFSDASKIDELIELYNIFSENNSSEILSNNEYNLKYISNKCYISLFSFIKYSNKDEYIEIYYNKSDKNKSLSIDEIKPDELISGIISSIEYYDSDSYEIKEFLKSLYLLI